MYPRPAARVKKEMMSMGIAEVFNRNFFIGFKIE